MKQQQRFIVALVVSAAVLILWNYVFPPAKPPQPNVNANANANANTQPSTTSSPQPTSQPTTRAKPAQAVQASAPTAEPNPQRKLRIVTPLYEATLDTHGAVATSWIITRNKNTGREIYAANSTRSNPEPTCNSKACATISPCRKRAWRLDPALAIRELSTTLFTRSPRKASRSSTARRNVFPPNRFIETPAVGSARRGPKALICKRSA